ncbi:hypothetical protein JCM10207_006328 [Rhodosporidiobolus poonsookiae]
MLDRLLPELLDDILALTRTTPWHWWTRGEDDRGLAALCRTSSTIREHAQRLLFRDVSLSDARYGHAGPFEELVQQKPHLARQVRTFVLQSALYPDMDIVPLVKGLALLPLFPNLRAVCISSYKTKPKTVEEPLHLAPLASLPHLDTLILEWLILEHIPMGISFLALVSLSVSNVTTDNTWRSDEQWPACGGLLTPAILPSLRALALDFNPPPSASHLRLEMLQGCTLIDEEDIPILQTPSFPPHSDVLTFQLDMLHQGYLERFPPCHWRLLVARPYRRSKVSIQECLILLADFFAAAHAPPLSLHFSSEISASLEDDYSSEDGEVDDFEATLERIFKLARERKVEMRWHDENPDGEGLYTVSESCWRYVREVKAKEVQGGQP